MEMKTRDWIRVAGRGLIGLVVAGLGLVAVSCGTTGKTANRSGHAVRVRSTEHGVASWYSVRTNRGTRTASGRPLCNEASTAAHRRLPMGTKVRVTNLMNGKQEMVEITDRGPFVRGRVVDVTIGVARRLGFEQRGIVPVKIEVVEESPRG